MKCCPACKNDKNLTEFSKDLSRNDGVCAYCKGCSAKKHRSWYNEENRRKALQRSKDYYRVNRDKIKLQARANRSNKSKYMKLWRAKNKNKIIAYKNYYELSRKKTDIGYRMLCNIRNRIRMAMKTDSKTSPTKKLLGCSVQELKAHLESKFTKQMSWENYGIKGWHIDHIIPCSSFDLSVVTEQEKCFHYSNLQPLWCIDNIRKSDKIT